jgi:hypothetical protein
MKSNTKSLPDGLIQLINKEDLYKNLAFRLSTQNRPDRDICFPISTIKTLFYDNSEKVFFDKWIKTQIDNTIVLTKDAKYKLSQVDSVSIWEKGITVQIKGQPLDLYSNKADVKSGTFKVCVDELKQVVLDHIKPMEEILDENKTNLPTLRCITKRIYDADSSITTGQELRNVGSALLKKGVINKHDIRELKKELEKIAPQIQLRLMDSREHTKMHHQQSTNK